MGKMKDYFLSLSFRSQKCRRFAQKLLLIDFSSRQQGKALTHFLLMFWMDVLIHSQIHDRGHIGAGNPPAHHFLPAP